MADATFKRSELNPVESPSAAVGSHQNSPHEPTMTPATESQGYFTSNFEATQRENSNLPLTSSNYEMWSSFFQHLQSLQNTDKGSSTSLKKLKASEVYLPPFDPDDCQFTAVQWCDEIEHHRSNNSWTDYETKNAVYTHLQGRAKKWAARMYPLRKTWEQLRERLTRVCGDEKIPRLVSRHGGLQERPSCDVRGVFY